MLESTKQLQKLGLNLLEAEVYIYLLSQERSITAYQIGKNLGKPTANVYKAIEALARKGAVIINLGEPRVCRAIPVEEFLGQLVNTFQETTRQAAKSLSCLQNPYPDERIYQLRSVSLIFERFRLVLSKASKIVIVDAFPKAMELVMSTLEETAARGVSVYAICYEPVDIPGTSVVQAHQSDLVLRHWKSQQLNCVVDGQEVLIALMHGDLSDVYQSIWTSSPFMACIIHAGLMREHFFHNIASLKERKDFPETLKTILLEHPVFHAVEIPGQKLLFSCLGVNEEENNEKSKNLGGKK
jgi:sugar-specific transcriptional regulator TrmB